MKNAVCMSEAHWITLKGLLDMAIGWAEMATGAIDLTDDDLEEINGLSETADALIRAVEEGE